MRNEPSYERRPYRRRNSYGAWIAVGLAAVLIVVAIVVFQKQQASRPSPTQTPEVDAEKKRRQAEWAAQEKERRHQQGIRVLRAKLERVDRQIASNQERLKDEYSWSRDRDEAEAKELAAERAKIVGELAELGEEP